MTIKVMSMISPLRVAEVGPEAKVLTWAKS